ncbi:uncharacterized protein [Ptychodera flava]|uniref:uncharacterized protein isoform X2 n=1 Tax=Ptychodera flava TaxID=63121 RepID=UPI00396A7A38
MPILPEKIVQDITYLIQKMPSAPQINNGFSEYNVHQTFLVLKSVFGGKTAVGKMVTVVTILENYEEEMQSSSPV